MGRIRIWAALLGVYLVVCAVLDFLPYHGAPNFRYTGSDPSFAVWNFGWPLATFIYDPRFGLEVGPCIFFIPAECVVQAACIGVVVAVRWVIGWWRLRGGAALGRGNHTVL